MQLPLCIKYDHIQENQSQFRKRQKRYGTVDFPEDSLFFFFFQEDPE